MAQISVPVIHSEQHVFQGRRGVFNDPYSSYGRRTTVRMSKCALPASVSVLLCMLKLNSMLCCSKSVQYGFLLLLAALITVHPLCLGNRAPFSAANPPSEIGNSSPILALSQSLKFSWKEWIRFWSFSSFRIPKWLLGYPFWSKGSHCPRSTVRIKCSIKFTLFNFTHPT